MRVFLTGAGGYLGTVLVRHLAQLPEVEEITGIGLTKPSATANKLRFLTMDIRSPELSDVMADHEVVIHTACVVLWSAKMSAKERDEINLYGTHCVAQAALANKVNRFVHASSMAVYDPCLVRGQTNITEDFAKGNGSTSFYYWNAKAVAETILKKILGTATILTFLRPIYIIGPRNKSVVKSYQKNAVMFPGCNPRRQFIHEDDVAAAFIQAVRTNLPGEFNVVPDDFIRLSDLWKMVGANFVPRLPLSLARSITALRWRFLGSPVHPSWVEDMLMDFTGSNAKLKDTGWKPRYGSAEALQSAL
jgi:nucleoside-diphosphate-sugar epimerase